MVCHWKRRKPSQACQIETHLYLGQLGNVGQLQQRRWQTGCFKKSRLFFFCSRLRAEAEIEPKGQSSLFGDSLLFENELFLLFLL